MSSETDTTSNNYWKPCPECKSLGRVIPRKDKKISTEKRFVSVCPNCNGSGLVQSGVQSALHADLPHLAIVGGGIGGTALAVACLHRGIPFTLYERDSGFDVRTQGYGLTLQQASNALRGFGIESLSDGITSRRHLVHNQTGKVIAEWGMKRWGVKDNPRHTKRRNVHIARQSLRAELVKQLGDSSHIQWNHKLTDMKATDADGYKLTFDVGGQVISTNADLVVGADGIYSKVREKLIVESKNSLNYLGCYVILGICRVSALQSIRGDLLDNEPVFQTVNGSERMYMMPYDNAHIMWQFSFKTNVSQATKLNSYDQASMKQIVLDFVLDWHSPISEIVRATGVSRVTGYPVYDRETLDQNLLSDAGSATLIGDAAHPMSPFKGQGANQALLDALVLARALYTNCKEKQWRKNGLRAIVLGSFEANMIQRTRPKVLASAHAVEVLHSDAVLYEGDEPRGRGVLDEQNIGK